MREWLKWCTYMISDIETKFEKSSTKSHKLSDVKALGIRKEMFRSVAVWRNDHGKRYAFWTLGDDPS